jgi:Tfp pilus assembly protein PilX
MKTLLPTSKKSGFVILFAILVSTIILIMSAGIFRVAQKESILSSYSKESQIAFYSADAGVECALYWDISNTITSTKFPISQAPETLTEPFTCGVDEDNTPITIQAYKYDASGIYSHVFGFRYGGATEGSGCSFVFVEKNEPLAPTSGTPLSTTRVTAVGYNACEGNVPDVDDPTLLERRLSVSYGA